MNDSINILKKKDNEASYNVGDDQKIEILCNTVKNTSLSHQPWSFCTKVDVAQDRDDNSRNDTTDLVVPELKMFVQKCPEDHWWTEPPKASTKSTKVKKKSDTNSNEKREGMNINDGKLGRQIVYALRVLPQNGLPIDELQKIFHSKAEEMVSDRCIDNVPCDIYQVNQAASLNTQQKVLDNMQINSSTQSCSCNENEDLPSNNLIDSQDNNITDTAFSNTMVQFHSQTQKVKNYRIKRILKRLMFRRKQTYQLRKHKVCSSREKRNQFSIRLSTQRSDINMQLLAQSNLKSVHPSCENMSSIDSSVSGQNVVHCQPLPMPSSSTAADDSNTDPIQHVDNSSPQSKKKPKCDISPSAITTVKSIRIDSPRTSDADDPRTKQADISAPRQSYRRTSTKQWVLRKSHSKSPPNKPGKVLFTPSALRETDAKPVPVVRVDPVHPIYICDVGLTRDQCNDIVETAERCALTNGKSYAAYTYAKQTLGCRENDDLATICASPVMVAYATVRRSILKEADGAPAEDADDHDDAEPAVADGLRRSTPPSPLTAYSRSSRFARTNTGRGGDGSSSSSGGAAAGKSSSPDPKAKELVLDDREPHVVKYDVSRFERRKLDTHTDKSEWTFLIALSQGGGVDYEGGGTFFECFDTTVHLQQGQALIFPGKLRHRGQKIVVGRRFLLVGFLVERSSTKEYTKGKGAAG